MMLDFSSFLGFRRCCQKDGNNGSVESLSPISCTCLSLSFLHPEDFFYLFSTRAENTRHNRDQKRISTLRSTSFFFCCSHNDALLNYSSRTTSHPHHQLLVFSFYFFFFCATSCAASVLIAEEWAKVSRAFASAPSQFTSHGKSARSTSTHKILSLVFRLPSRS